MTEGTQESLEGRLSIAQRLARGETVRVEMPPLKLTYEEERRFALLNANQLAAFQMKFELGKPISAEEHAKYDQRVNAYMREHGFDEPYPKTSIN